MSGAVESEVAQRLKLRLDQFIPTGAGWHEGQLHVVGLGTALALDGLLNTFSELAPQL